MDASFDEEAENDEEEVAKVEKKESDEVPTPHKEDKEEPDNEPVLG